MKTKKELKNIYKEKKFKIGVFQIRNIQNNKILISSSTDLDAIWNRHKFQLDFGSHFNKELQKDFNEVGEEGFSFDILDSLKPKEDVKYDYTDDLKILEEMWLTKLQPYDEEGYNTKDKHE